MEMYLLHGTVKINGTWTASKPWGNYLSQMFVDRGHGTLDEGVIPTLHRWIQGYDKVPDQLLPKMLVGCLLDEKITRKNRLPKAGVTKDS